MIEICRGDLLRSDAEALVNTVNCVGVMGKGIAKAFKAGYPENFKLYEAACATGRVRTGEMFVTEPGDMFGPKWIVNFPTKREWRDGSQMQWIDSGLKALADFIETRKVSSIAVPALGCSNGGLGWVHVRPRIEAALGHLAQTRVFLYPPQGL